MSLIRTVGSRGIGRDPIPGASEFPRHPAEFERTLHIFRTRIKPQSPWDTARSLPTGRGRLHLQVETAAKILIGIAGILLVAGLGLLLASKLGLSRLPGDIVVKRGNVTIYAPIGLMIFVSVVLTVILNVLARR